MNPESPARPRVAASVPGLRHIVLECTNMPPYRDAMARAAGLPAHDIETRLLDSWRARPV